MGFFSDIFNPIGALIGGGGGSQETTVSQGTTVNVDVNPQIGIDIDTTAISEAISSATAAGQTDIAALVAAGQAQTRELAGAVAGSFSGLADTVSKIALAAGALYLVMR